MMLHTVLILMFSVLVAPVIGQRQCTNDRKCIPFEDCLEYKSYVNKSSKSWPQSVREEVKALYCGVQPGETGKIYSFCCKRYGRDFLDLEKCGKTVTDRIANGDIAEVFQFPWMALLGDINGEFHCGGSLIAERFVLTAAHCNRKRVFVVRVGETDLSSPIDCKITDYGEDCAEPHQDIQVDRFISHPVYSTSTKKNDIALVKLTKSVRFNSNVRPICLPLPEMLRKDLPRVMIVSGWGYTEDKNALSDQLRFANIPIVDQSRCKRVLLRMSDVYTVDENQVCAGDGTDLVDHCHGDSGGPLQYFGTSGYVIHGVVSWGLDSCGQTKAPGVYTKVEQYMDWIMGELK